MSPMELRDTLTTKPFEPFRLVMTDGATYEVRHPDMLWVGFNVAYVGRTGAASTTFFERSVKLDLNHITQIVPLEAVA